MKAGAVSRVDTLRELFRFAKAIERRGNKMFTQPELAEELQVSTRTITRYLQTFREQLGLVVETSEKSRAGSVVVGKWKFMDALAAYYRRAA